jgi:hypothetical protein
MRRFKKALSNTVVTILLILIVIIGGLAVSYIYRNFANIASSKAQLNIVNMELRKSTGAPAVIFTATLKNTGNKPVAEIKLRLHNETEWTILSSNDPPLQPGRSTSAVITPPNIHPEYYVVGLFYTVVIKAKATDGSEFAHTTTVMCRGESGGEGGGGGGGEGGEGEVLLVFRIEGASLPGDTVVLTVDGETYTVDELPLELQCNVGDAFEYAWTTPVEVNGEIFILAEVKGLSHEPFGFIVVPPGGGEVVGRYEPLLVERLAVTFDQSGALFTSGLEKSDTFSTVTGSTIKPPVVPLSTQDRFWLFYMTSGGVVKFKSTPRVPLSAEFGAWANGVAVSDWTGLDTFSAAQDGSLVYLIGAKRESTPSGYALKLFARVGLLTQTGAVVFTKTVDVATIEFESESLFVRSIHSSVDSAGYVWITYAVQIFCYEGGYSERPKLVYGCMRAYIGTSGVAELYSKSWDLSDVEYGSVFVVPTSTHVAIICFPGEQQPYVHFWSFATGDVEATQRPLISCYYAPFGSATTDGENIYVAYEASNWNIVYYRVWPSGYEKVRELVWSQRVFLGVVITYDSVNEKLYSVVIDYFKVYSLVGNGMREEWYSWSGLRSLFAPSLPYDGVWPIAVLRNSEDVRFTFMEVELTPPMVLSVDGKPYSLNELPVTIHYTRGSTCSFEWASSTHTGPQDSGMFCQNIWYKTTGLSMERRGNITVESSGYIWGHYDQECYCGLWIDVRGGGTTDPEPGIYLYEGWEEVTVRAIAQPGNAFVEWWVDDEDVEESEQVTVTMDEPHTLIAFFEENDFNMWLEDSHVWFARGGQASTTLHVELVLGSPKTVTLTFEHDPAITVSLSAESGNPPFTSTVTVSGSTAGQYAVTIHGTNGYKEKEVVLHVSVGKPYYTLSASVNNPLLGLVGLSANGPWRESFTARYVEGTQVNVYASPVPGEAFSYWLLDGENVGSDNPIAVFMDSDHTITAVFEDLPEEYVLSVSVNKEGLGQLRLNSEVIDPGTYHFNAGSTAELRASPGADNYFLFWIIDGTVNDANPVTVTMNADHSVKAYFVPKTLTSPASAVQWSQWIGGPEGVAGVWVSPFWMEHTFNLMDYALNEYDLTRFASHDHLTFYIKFYTTNPLPFISAWTNYMYCWIDDNFPGDTIFVGIRYMKIKDFTLHVTIGNHDVAIRAVHLGNDYFYLEQIAYRVQLVWDNSRIPPD